MAGQDQLERLGRVVAVARVGLEQAVEVLARLVVAHVEEVPGEAAIHRRGPPRPRGGGGRPQAPKGARPRGRGASGGTTTAPAARAAARCTRAAPTRKRASKQSGTSRK